MTNNLEKLKRRFRESYGGDPSVIAEAPGRVEIIGNHTDHNKGPVLGAAIDRYVTVAIRRTNESVFKFSSAGSAVVILEDVTRPLAGSSSWINYPLGVYNALIRRGLVEEGGFEIAVESDVPSGAGLSSSAALELACGKAMGECYGIHLEKDELAKVGQEAENDFVGVPCGILDQGVSAFGELGKLVYIDCMHLSFSTLTWGDEVRLWIFNTHKEHSLVESLYSKRYDECQRAVEQLKRLGLEIDCLADVSPEQFERLKSSLEETLSKRAEHVIYEIDRVNRFRRFLEEDRKSEAGALMFESHQSSRILFENSAPELDYLVDILKSMPEVLGARLTGGGFGGAVIAIAGETFSDQYANAVASAYRGHFGTAPEVISCRIGQGARVLETV